MRLEIGNKCVTGRFVAGQLVKITATITAAVGLMVGVGNAAYPKMKFKSLSGVVVPLYWY
jgi:hypothetical protein